MKLKGVDHVAIAVEDLDATIAVLQQILGLEVAHREEIAGYGVVVATLELGTTAVELVAPTTTDSPIRKFLDKRGPGIHHIALATDDIEAAIEALSASGGEMIDATPRPGKQGSRVAFIHPRSTARILFELVENRD